MLQHFQIGRGVVVLDQLAQFGVQSFGFVVRHKNDAAQSHASGPTTALGHATRPRQCGADTIGSHSQSGSLLGHGPLKLMSDNCLHGLKLKYNPNSPRKSIDFSCRIPAELDTMMRFLLFAVLLTAGCVESQKQALVSKPKWHSPCNSRGLSLTTANDKSLLLAPALSESAVIELLGLPDETSGGVNGTLTGAPWQAFDFYYKWHWSDGWVISRRTLNITFRFDESATNWIVNSWKWNNN